LDFGKIPSLDSAEGYKPDKLTALCDSLPWNDPSVFQPKQKLPAIA